MQSTPAEGYVRQRLRDWRTPPTATDSVMPLGLDKKRPNLKACVANEIDFLAIHRGFDQMGKERRIAQHMQKRMACARQASIEA